MLVLVALGTGHPLLDLCEFVLLDLHDASKEENLTSAILRDPLHLSHVLLSDFLFLRGVGALVVIELGHQFPELESLNLLACV